MNTSAPGPVRARAGFPAALALAATLAACAGRAPVIVPPSSGVEAVEGFGSAVLEGTEARMKGKFAFLFRRPNFGRVEALDPVGRTAFYIFFREDRAYFVLPAKKVYTDEKPEAMMERFLGAALRPDDLIRLLSGSWAADGGGTGGRVERDDDGRIVGGGKNGFTFRVRTFFPGGGVPRELGLEGPGTTGRLKVLSLGFNPPPRAGAFEIGFLRTYTLKTWGEVVELIDR